MGQDILISVIVPVYNVESYLARCVASIRAQTYQNLEIILVDDGSKDASGDLCEAFAREDFRIRVIHKENGGLSSARNAGIDIAKGEYFSFVDSDDWIEEDTLEVLLATALEEKVQLVCCGRYDVNSETGERTLGLCHERKENISAEEFLKRIFTWDNCDFSACDKLFHRDMFQHYRFPFGKRSEDVAVMYRIIDQTDRVSLLPKACYNYYHRVNSISMAVKVSENTFHFLEHTYEILEYIQEKHPAILDSARYFHFRALLFTLQSLELTDEAARGEFRDRMRDCRRQLWQQLPFVLSCANASRREKIISLMIVLNIYRLFHLVKGTMRKGSGQ